MTKKVSAKGTAAHQKSAERALVKQKTQDARKSLKAIGAKTGDSFQNFALNLGQGTNNALSSSTYGFNPITRVRTELEWIHRGSWLGGVAVDIPADDMTREGVTILSDMTPDEKETLEEMADDLDVWNQLNNWIKWAGLYGGAILVPLIDGQDLSTPFNPERVGKGQFKGLLVLDRWMVEPSLEDLVTQPGPDLGKPRFYRVTSDAPGYRLQKIHYTRAFRNVGIELPYWQAVMENLWGISCFERLYDRMVAFDSASMGAAQMVYRAWVRTLKMKRFREANAVGGDLIKGVVKSVEFMRMYQGIEGISIIDAEDDLEIAGAGQSMAGVSDALIQFAQQLAGALQIPLVRLFGQSPAGLNSTGESDLRTYYEGIAKRQKKQMKRPVKAIYEIMARSAGINTSGGMRIKFKPLWQLDDKEKAEVAKNKTETVLGAYDAAVIDRHTALQEMRAISEETGVFSNVTDELIAEALNDPPVMQPGEIQEQTQQNLEASQNANPQAVKPGAANVKSLGPGKTSDRARIVDFHGIPLHIETFYGEERTGKGADGQPWRAVLAADYGYFDGTASAEGPLEQMDMFLGPNPMMDSVYVIDQIEPLSGRFDEHKVMLGFPSLKGALLAYMNSYSDNAEKRIGGISPMTVDQLKGWLRTGDVSKPLTKIKEAA